MKLTDVIIHEKLDPNSEYLNNKMFDVNVRLLQDNNDYRNMISVVIEYIKQQLKTSFADVYGTQKSISAAVLGIPWNIVAFRDNSDHILALINPRIANRSKLTTKIYSKCPSLDMKDNIPVMRYDYIDVEFYDIYGQKAILTDINRANNVAALQHEINHNYGICILDEEEL